MAAGRLAQAVDAFRGSFLQLAALVLTGIASILVLCVARVQPTALPLFVTWPSGAPNTTADARAVVVGGIGVCARLSNQTATTEGASIVQAGPFICAERLSAGITEPLPNTAAGDVVTALASSASDGWSHLTEQRTMRSNRCRGRFQVAGSSGSPRCCCSGTPVGSAALDDGLAMDA